MLDNYDNFIIFSLSKLNPNLTQSILCNANLSLFSSIRRKVYVYSQSWKLAIILPILKPSEDSLPLIRTVQLIHVLQGV